MPQIKETDRGNNIYYGPGEVLCMELLFCLRTEETGSSHRKSGGAVAGSRSTEGSKAASRSRRRARPRRHTVEEAGFIQHLPPGSQGG